MPRVPFAFDFESDQSNDNSVTKQLPNYHLAVSEKSVEQPSAIQLFDQLYPNLTNGIRHLLCYQITIWSFRLKLKRKRNLRYFENTYLVDVMD